jgi:hypothetical protein
MVDRHARPEQPPIRQEAGTVTCVRRNPKLGAPRLVDRVASNVCMGVAALAAHVFESTTRQRYCFENEVQLGKIWWYELWVAHKSSRTILRR